MEAKLYARLYRLVHETPHPPRRPGERYDDRHVVLVHLWGVLHDRGQAWACDPDNWPAAVLGGRPLVSQPRLSRRLRSVTALQLLERVLAAAGDRFGPPPLAKAIDSKPLTVGAYSKDADATRGRLADGAFGRGYRLHAVVHGRAVRDWTLLPLGCHDAVGAAVLLPRLAGGGGYVTADNAYDSNANHSLAAGAGHQLVAPPRACNRHVRDARANRPERLRALDALHGPLAQCGVPGAGAFGAALYAQRQQVESAFGGLTFAGLGPLPPFVRGPRRVALWTAGKILVHLCRTAMKQGLMA
jgi:hypothetical protein